MSSDNITHKTILLLDHCIGMKEASGITVEIDQNAGRSTTGRINSNYLNFLPPVTKPLWTCIVEAALEYGRIVWDVFSEERLLKFILNDPQAANCLNTWDTVEQNMTFIGDTFANSGPPRQSPGNIQLGIKSAISELSFPSQVQNKIMEENKNSYRIVNRGRIICITSCVSDVDLEAFFESSLVQHNRNVGSSDQLLPIHECEFILISAHPVNKLQLARILSKSARDVSNILRTEIHVVSVEYLYERLTELCTNHHNLIITTITGIPMKEEQNALSSSNYDVALFHQRLSSSNAESSVLKWSTVTAPKGAGLGPTFPCNSATRITPVDVSSRPSCCLSNFVANGRSVWLETPKKGKSITHVLTSHGGEMWMQIMDTCRNILEDPPSISEGIGGRITDYRITDFVDYMKLNMLSPFPSNGQSNYQLKQQAKQNQQQINKPVAWAKSRLGRKNTFWPLTIGGSSLFAMSVHLGAILKLMPKDSLNDADKVECDKTIWALMSVEARGDPPPLPSSYHKKGQKRDEQWALVYTELEAFIRANLHSENHNKVLECFLESRRRDDKVQTEGNSRMKDIDRVIAELEAVRSGSKTEILDSPLSPSSSPPPQQTITPKEIAVESKPSKKLNLLDLWKQKTYKKDLRPLPITGIKLYCNLESQQDDKKK